MKRLASLMLLLGLTGVTAPSSGTTSATFCTRLAANMGIEQPATGDDPNSWTANALNFGQRFLVGGSAATSVGVSPVEPSTVEDYRRLENMCAPDRKGAACKLSGPVNFNVTWKGRRTVTVMESGERATVSVAGTKMICQSDVRL